MKNPLFNKLPELSLKYALEQYLYTDTFTQRFQDLWNSLKTCWFGVSLGHDFVWTCFNYFIVFYYYVSLLRSDPWSGPMIRSDDPIRDPVLWSDPVKWSDPMIRSTHWNSICTQILLHRDSKIYEILLKDPKTCWFCVSLGHVFVRRCFYYFIIIFIITFFWLRSDPWSDPMIWSMIRSNDPILWSSPWADPGSVDPVMRAGLAMRTTIKIRYIIFITF